MIEILDKNEERMIEILADQISLIVYPEQWHHPRKDLPEFKVDHNAGKRAVAKEVAAHFLTVIKSEAVSKRITKSFVRRYQGEQAVDNLDMEYCHMLTAMLAIEIALGDCESLDH